MQYGIAFDEAAYAMAVVSQMSVAEAKHRIHTTLFDLRDAAQKAQALFESNTFPRVAFFRTQPGMYAYARRVHSRHCRKILALPARKDRP